MIDCFDKEFAFLSNFYPSEIEYEGIIYPTVEHFFQAMKTLNQEERKSIAKLATPGKAKRAGRRVNLRSDWEDVKDEAMLTGLRLKFIGHPDLGSQLISTGDEYLIEGNTWHDCYWGMCEGKGSNHLGRLLMQVREEIQ